MPYISNEKMLQISKNYIDKTGDFGMAAAMLQLLSKDMSNYIANKYLESSYDKNVAYLFTPYLNN